MTLLFFWSGRLTVYMVPTKITNTIPGAIDWYNLAITLYRLAIGMKIQFYATALPWSYAVAPLISHSNSVFRIFVNH